jgi:hypothetical protein
MGGKEVSMPEHQNSAPQPGLGAQPGSPAQSGQGSVSQPDPKPGHGNEPDQPNKPADPAVYGGQWGQGGDKPPPPDLPVADAPQKIKVPAEKN